MGGILIWLAKTVGETILGHLLAPIFNRIFPSTDQRLGTAEQKVKDDEAVIQSVQEKQKIDQSVAVMSDADAANELRKWERD